MNLCVNKKQAYAGTGVEARAKLLAPYKKKRGEME